MGWLTRWRWVMAPKAWPFHRMAVIALINGIQNAQPNPKGQPVSMGGTR